ncbi:MAG: NAD(P)-dependent oxidoreductase [Thermoguttaceae bacterium]|jgi:dTDP-4-dehydrorhamnose reductase
MKIVVTGALGQLGGELCRQIGPQAIPLDIDTLDLTGCRAVLETLLPLRPETIINCAAYTQVDKAEKEPELAYAVNSTSVENLVRVCRELDCPLVQISTDYVFSGNDRGQDTVGSGQWAVGSGQRETASGFKQNSHSDLHSSSFILHPSTKRPYREDDRPSPQGVYARSKLAGERAAAEYEKHIVVRTCGLYARASDGRANNFVKIMLRLGSKQAEIRVVADQHCTPSYVPHVARAVLFLVGFTNAAPAPWGIYHVTNSGETTWYDFAVEIFKQADLNVSVKPITTAEYGAPAARPCYSVLDTGAYHLLGGPAMPDWKIALEEYFIEWKAMQI